MYYGSVNSVISYAQTFALVWLDLCQQKRYKIADICLILQRDLDNMNENNNMIMKDIARELGVSVATVSRALKDSPRISAAQKERIQTFAREHNFFPNILGEDLRYSKVQPMKVIGVIVPEFVHYTPSFPAE